MKIVPLTELLNQNFNVAFINSLKQYWRTTKYFGCINAPKSMNLFLYLDGCKITYTDKNNRTITAESGDCVYTPVGSEYKSQLFDFENQDSHTVGINFMLFDMSGESVVLSDDIEVFRKKDNPSLSMLFHRSLHREASEYFTPNRILLMEILNCLSDDITKSSLDRIGDALKYMSEHIEENPSVAELAKICHVSEVYFRKLFKSRTGVTPVEYRTSLRLDKAKSYLEYGDITVQEISDALGYSAVSHFIKEFKRCNGVSPLQYRKRRCKSSF